MLTQTIFTTGLIIAMGASLFLVYASYRKVLAEGKRPFGFYCDTCTGKFDKNMNPYIRCLIKPRILQLLGVNINQTTVPRQEPGECWDD